MERKRKKVEEEEEEERERWREAGRERRSMRVATAASIQRAKK